MKKNRITMVIVLVVCVALIVSLIGVIVHYSGVVGGKDSEIAGLVEEISETEATIESLEEENENLKRENQALNETIKTLTSNMTIEAQTIADLKDIIHGLEPLKLKTIVFHISEKGEDSDWGRTPDVQYTYQKILNGSSQYEVLLLPEYKGNLNWTETFEWISSNFTGIPIALSAFEGGYDKLPNPNVDLTLNEIQQAKSACDVRMVRFSEMISWYLGQNQIFPLDYVRSILDFCKQNNVGVLWSEWKIGDDVIPLLQNYIAGYEDIVTVLCQTNTEFNEPLEGFMEMRTFQHWGASVQNWYWVEKYGGDEMDMPTSFIIRHVQTATSMGAEVLQFESYRYFFDNGEPRDILSALGLAI